MLRAGASALQGFFPPFTFGPARGLRSRRAGDGPGGLFPRIPVDVRAPDSPFPLIPEDAVVVPGLPDRDPGGVSGLVDARRRRPFDPGNHRPQGFGVPLGASLFPSRMGIPLM